MFVRVSSVGDSSCHTRLIIRGTEENSFISLKGSNYYYSVTTPIDLTAGAWCYLGGKLRVREEDIQASSGTFNLMLDVLECADNQVVYIDNVNIRKINTNDLEFSITPPGRTMAIGQKQAFIGSYTTGVTYKISNTNIATVDNTGVVTAVSGGKTRLEICRTATGQREYAFVVVAGWNNFSNGTYYITNVGQEGYMQSNNNSANKLELWDFDNENDQKWYLTYINSGGYYKITRNNDNNYALTAVDYDLLTQTDVKLQAYSNLESQHWYIQPLSNHKYKIWPESGKGENICLSSRFNINTEGNDVLTNEYSGDEKEQWYLHKVGGNDVFLATINDEDNVDRVWPFGKVMTYLRALQYDRFNVIAENNYIATSVFIDNIENSEIFVFNGHGRADPGSTSIKLTSTSTGPRLYSTDIYEGTTAKVDFSNTELMIFASCHSAGNLNDRLNLVDASALAGSSNVVGFEGTIDSRLTNQWIVSFFEYYYKSQDVNLACEYATRSVGYLGELNTFVVRNGG